MVTVAGKIIPALCQHQPTLEGQGAAYGSRWQDRRGSGGALTALSADLQGRLKLLQ